MLFLDLLDSGDFIASLPVEDKNLIAGGSLEGYLYPDTYLFSERFSCRAGNSPYGSVTFFESLRSIYPFYKEFSPDKMQEKMILAFHR